MGAVGKVAKTVGTYAVGGPLIAQAAAARDAMTPDAPTAQRQVSKQEYDAAIAKWSIENADSGDDYQKNLQAFKDTMSVLPPPAPDLADEAVQKARQAARRKLLMGGMVGPLDLSGGTTKPIPGLTGA